MINKLVDYKSESILAWNKYLQGKEKDLNDLDKVMEHWKNFNYKRTGLKVCFNKPGLNKWLNQWYSYGGALADRILEILNMTNVEFVETYRHHIITVENCTFWEDDNSIIYYKLILISTMLCLNEVETFTKETGNEDFSSYTVYYYLNAGDVYNKTLIYNIDSKEIFLGCPGDLME